MSDIKDKHIKGVLRLIAPEFKADATRKLVTPKGRKKWLNNLAHSIEMHRDYSKQPAKGQRDPHAIYRQLLALGAGKECYVFASDCELDDTFQPLKAMIDNQYDLFGHGTILSCIAGELALYRSAWPHQNLIIHRPKHMP